MYRTGQGAPADQAQALAWYRKAADQDNPGAQYALAQDYLTGQGVPRNEHTAVTWLQKAALHGYTPAQLDLGRRYVQGKGVARDDTLAMEWLQKAADDGDPDAATELAQIAGRVGHTPKQLFSAMMDRVFGAGRWRETGGFRTRAQENALRKEGAGTVRLGEVSRHSMGNEEGPGAYDVVVTGMSPAKAALKLKRSGEPLQRVVCEQLHGDQGPHLHVEPKLTSEYVSVAKPSLRRAKRARAESAMGSNSANIFVASGKSLSGT
jgi:hypothetical protein